MKIDQSIRQLLVSCAFAAINHGLFQQAETIAAAFPELIDDVEMQIVCQSLLLFGLQQPAAAWHLLSGCSGPEAERLRQLIHQAEPEIIKQRDVGSLFLRGLPV